MRSSNDPNLKGAFWCGDRPDGKVEITGQCWDNKPCPVVIDFVNEIPLYCPKCQKELVYRPWYEW